MHNEIRRSLLAAAVILAASALVSCSASPTAPATSSLRALVPSAQTASASCSKVDGTWVCSDTARTSTTSDTIPPSPATPICYLDDDVWICVGS